MYKIKTRKAILSILLTLAMVSALFVNISLMSDFSQVSAVSNSESFYRSVAQLVENYWSDDYIGSIELQIGNPIMSIDGEEKEIDPGRGTSPILVDGRTLIPIRTLIEETGGDVLWDNSQQIITIDNGDEVIEMQIGSDAMLVNGVSTSVDVAPIIVNSRTMVPLRVATENLGFELEWSNSTQTVVLTRKFQTKRLIVKTYSDMDFSYFGAEVVLNGADNISILQFATISETQEAYDRLRGTGNVAYVEPDTYIPPIVNSSEEMYNQYKSWGVERIGADKYADYLTKSGKTQQVTVAVLDTGVDAGHSFLSGRILSGYNFVDGNTNTSDVQGHGTHVSGTIVDCTQGLSNIKIVPVKVLNDYGSGTWLMVGNGIEYAADRDIDVINMSLGGGHSDFMDEKTQYAINKGVTVVVAAGNDRQNASNYCPAHITNAITVAATDSSDRPANFTNWGDVVDIAAPGVSVESSIPGNRFGVKSGTSMATPHVAAVAAMYILNNPTLTPADVENLVKQYYEIPNGWDSRFGVGIVNIGKAVPDTETHMVRFNVIGGNGTVTAMVDGEEITSGTNVQQGKNILFTAHPDNGYRIKNWILGNSVTRTNNPLTDDNTYNLINLSSSVTVTVELESTTSEHTVRFNVIGGNGTVTAMVDGEVIESGASVQEGKNIVFNANPDSGYRVKSWMLTNSTRGSIPITGNTYTLNNLSSSVTVTVELEPIGESHMVTFSVLGGNGTVTATVDGKEITSGTYVEEGKNVVFTANPDSGYRVKNWILGNSSRSGGLSNSNTTYTLINLSSSTNIMLEFESE